MIGKARTGFKLALAQIRVLGGKKTQNLSRAQDAISAAAQAGASIVVLPEAMTLGWTHPAARTEADEIPGGYSCRVLQEAARQNGVFVCSGLIEKDQARVFNAAVLISPSGEILAHHRKVNELDIAHDLYALGDRLQVARTPLGSIGLMVCADAFARGQVISRTLGYMGADIILSPSAWAVPSDYDHAKQPYGQLWLDNYGPVANDFQIWIAGVSNVGPIEAGPWAGRQCIGCSLVVGPDGKEALRGPYGADADTLLCIDVELRPRPAQGDGWARVWGDPGSA